MTSKLNFHSILAAIVALFGALASPALLNYLPGKFAAVIVVIGILIQAVTPSISKIEDAWAHASGTATKTFGLGAVVAFLLAAVGAASSPDILALLPARAAAILTLVGVVLNALSPALVLPNTSRVPSTQ